MNIKIIKKPEIHETEVDIFCEKESEHIRLLYHHISQFTSYITGKLDRKEYRIAYYDIYYMESVDGKTFLYTENGVYESPISLSAIEKQLSVHSPFVRIGKSCILNINMLQHVEPCGNHRLLATLKNGESQIINRSYVLTVKEKLEQSI